MLSFLLNIWQTDFMPHGHCYFWEPGIMWTHAISDSIIALAYLIIPLSLIKIVRRRNDFTYMWMLVLFAIFILGCGATHVMDVINIWEPFYYTDSAIRIITALASIGTALLLIRVTPQLILFPSAKKWKELNEELRTMNEQLEFKVQERSLRYQEIATQFEFMTDVIPQLVWTADSRGQIIYFNKNWYNYTGFEQDSSAFSKWPEALHPDDRDAIVESWEALIRKGEKFEMEIRIRQGSDHSYRWHLARTVPMKSGSGKALKWFGTGTDIHDQKMQQHELQRINEELDNFVYIASHDLKTPINNMEGLLKVLDHRLSPSSQKESAPVRNMMHKSVEQLKSTIDDLADISRIQREDTVEETEATPVNELIEEFKLNHHVLMQESRARIECRLELKDIYFPRKHLRSIIDNLLSNALKYRMPGRLPRIKIHTYSTPHHQVIVVEDNGLGIRKEHQPRVFDMFRRFHHQVEGTGVGLHIVKKIVEKYKGSITLDSEVEKGSVFQVFLKKPEKMA
jgi:PAS domain S-box-containing protein